MARNISWIDRVRIEMVVWSLDHRLYDLPRHSRNSKRREVRANLMSAAQDIGTSAALARLGNSRALAQGYLSAEYGDGPRASGVTAALVLFTGLLLLNSILFDAAIAYRDGLLTGIPEATGQYSWSGISPLQESVQFTFTNGSAEIIGGGLSPIAWGLLVIAAILAGRLWRIPLAWRRGRSAAGSSPA